MRAPVNVREERRCVMQDEDEGHGDGSRDHKKGRYEPARWQHGSAGAQQMLLNHAYGHHSKGTDQDLEVDRPDA